MNSDQTYLPPNPHPKNQSILHGNTKEVLDAESAQVASRRRKAWENIEDPYIEEPESPGDQKDTPVTPPASWDTVGLAISGGGIRSATFGLGVLQGLASMKVLRCVDYLSAVSGGSYISACFTAWVQRTGSLDHVTKQLDPDWAKHEQPVGGAAVGEPDTIRHLREFSNYLTPKMSLFSADTWTLIAIYLRNLLANQLCLLPALLLVPLIARMITQLYTLQIVRNDYSLTVPSAIICLVILAAFKLVAMSLADLDAEEKEKRKWTWPLGFSSKCWWTITLLTIAAPVTIWFMTPVCIQNLQGEWIVFRDRLPLWQFFTRQPLIRLHNGHSDTLIYFIGLFSLMRLAPISYWLCKTKTGTIGTYLIASLAVVFSYLRRPDLAFIYHLGLGGFALASTLVVSAVAKREPWKPRFRQIVATAVSGAAGGALFYALLYNVLWKHADNVALISTLGPAGLMAIIGISSNLEIVLIGHVASDAEREWWGRMSAWCLIVAISWATVFGLSLFGGLGLLMMGAWLKTTVTIGWLGSGAAALLAGRNSKVSGRNESSWAEYALSLTPYAFLIGLMCLMSLWTHAIAHHEAAAGTSPHEKGVPSITTVQVVSETSALGDTQWTAKRTVQRKSDVASKYLDALRKSDIKRLSLAIIICVSIVWLANYLVEVNEFSLNAADANRLTRCYLGASRDAVSDGIIKTPFIRAPNDLTGFDPLDDFPLRDLAIGEPRRHHEKHKDSKGEIVQDQDGRPIRYWGPYLIINTAVNLVSGDNLAWQERLSESFVLTPLWLGSHDLGYLKNEFKESSGIRIGSLGRAVAISGAAANPNMGYHSSPAITALMTLFNVRMGWWFPNPRKNTDVNLRPSSLLKWLLIELFGFTNGEREFVNLSDGGHFDNLGVYELVRRRCRLIIVSDAESDPDRSFHGLGTVIRRCRSDFGIDIEIQLDTLKCDPTTGASAQHCVVGTIRYDQVDVSAPVGTLLYIKSTLTGDEPSDIKQYAQAHPEFPHEPTIDQFFSESQFESYRTLGLHSAQSALSETTGRLKDVLEGFSSAHNQNEAVQNLVYHLRGEWFAPPPQTNEDFVNAAKTYAHLHEQLRGDGRLSRISQELYPELSLPQGSDDPSVAWDCELLRASLQKLKHTKNTHEIATHADQVSQQIERLCLEPHQRLRELHLVIMMVEVLENAWYATDLSKHQGHPLNAGWMNVFRRWSLVPSIRRVWPILRHEFSRDFVRFCENWAMFSCGERKLVEDQLSEPELKQIFEEFALEWPADDPKSYGMALRLADWIRPQAEGVWIRYLRVSSQDAVDQVDFVAGVVGFRTIHPGTHEFFVWVRPQFREHGLGMAMMEHDIVAKKRDELSETGRIIIRYPCSQWIGKGRKVAKSRWMSYFDFYDYRRITKSEEQDIFQIALPGLPSEEFKDELRCAVRKSDGGNFPIKFDERLNEELKKAWSQFEILKYSSPK